MPALISFLEGNIFGYLQHTVQIVFAEILFGFSLKKKERFALRLVVALLIYLPLSLGLELLFERFLPYGCYLISFLLSFLIYPILYKAKLWDGLFCVAAAIVMQNLSFSVATISVEFLGLDPKKVGLLCTSVQVIVYILIHVLVFGLCYKRLKDVNGAGEEKLSMIFISLVLTAVIYILQRIGPAVDGSTIWWRIMIIFYDVLALFMLFGMYDRSKLRRENAILDSLRASEEKQYEFDKRAIEMVNLKCHDLQHQLMALRNMVGAEQEQALKEIEEAVLIYNSVAKTGCKPLDTILSNKYLICEKYNIRFTYMIDGEKLAFMKASDVYSLFGNALDNAIRAETAVEDVDKRVIDVSMAAKGKILTIHMENYCETEVVFKNGIPVTTKEDADNHGFGMISIKRIVEQYGGVMSVECSNKMFRLDITIPIKTLQNTKQ
ncbi:MAG: sensor histidine kinase [Clostridia bacterium]|nr:sensor histidine kinase [Clostridia bacterium]